MHQSYFSPAAFRFLDTLDQNNSRTWFHAHEDEYERHVREPFQRLINDMQKPLAKISQHFRADARKVGGSLFRIHRDTRFSHNKLPYKSWQGARFFHERRREIPAPSFYLQIQPGDCFAGGGLWHPQNDTLKNIRGFLADNPAAWTKATQGKRFRERFTMWGESLVRPPRGFDPAHELIEDLKRKSFATGDHFDERLACSTELLPWTMEVFKTVAPMIDYLCAAQELEF